jgi:glycolate oxidase iron-sulfur subunit
VNKPSLAQLKKYEEIVAACNRCGFCTSYCPTYNATGNEAHSPRGRKQLVRSMIEGTLAYPTAAAESIDACLLCGECTSVCFSEVPTAQLMVAARHYLNDKQALPAPVRFIFSFLLPYPQRLRWMVKASFLAKRMGLTWIAKKIGLLKLISPALAAADDLVTHVPLRFLLDDARVHQKRAATRQADAFRKSTRAPAANAPTALAAGKIAYMPVCGSQYLRPSIGLATLSLLELLNVDIVIPEVACCGLPAASAGALPNVLDIARKNIEYLERGYFDSIVIDDSSCGAHVKEYPRYFQDDAAWLKRAHNLAQKVRDLPTYFVQKGLKERLARVRWQGAPVAFHDPCKAQYAQKITAPPRDLLQSIAGLKLVPITDADQCCGGAGTYSFTHPEMSQAVVEAKVKNIIASGCGVVVTSSASCLTQLAFGLRRAKSNVVALHLTEFFARAIRKGR